MTNSELEAIVLKTARIAAATAKAVEPLISSREPKPSPLGGTTHHPTAGQTAKENASEADELLALLPKDIEHPATLAPATFQTRVSK